MDVPPLKPLHRDDRLIKGKLDKYDRASTEELVESLLPGKPGSLKVRPDGTIIDGHHRIKVLRGRGVDVDALPREVIPREELEGEGQ
jgi:hypothetical protein